MSTANILVVDDEKKVRDSICEMLHQEEYEVTTAENADNALKQLQKKRFNLVLAKAQMRDKDGFELLSQIKNNWIDTKVILITTNGTVPSAIKAMKLGASYYLDKFDGSADSKLKQIITDILVEHPDLIEGDYQRSGNGFHGFVGGNSQMQAIYTLIKKVADSDATVLIGGETGTGKTLVAKAIHNQSRRRECPFIKVDCAGIPEELLESELFGHVRGSFTTALRDKKGKFELADKGTLFLDDIDCLPMKLQAKLLRVLQDREFEKVGGISIQKVDVRIIAASNQDLQTAVVENTFRADLFYRLNVINIYLPPLRDRLDDLKELASHFLEAYNRKNHNNVLGISAEAFAVMQEYSWPGNIRQLENAIERAVVLKQQGDIEPDDLGLPSQDNATFVESPTCAVHLPLKDYLKEVEKNKIIATLEECNWKRNKTSEALGISRITLYTKMRDYHIVSHEQENN